LSSLLEKLLEINAASGFEQEMRDFLTEKLRPIVDEIYIDSLGSLICSKYGPNKKPKVMIAAHMDEIGMLIKFIDENGFLYFAPLGGIHTQAIANQRVIIQTEKGPIPGIIGTKSIHQQTEKERKQALEMDAIFIDNECHTYLNERPLCDKINYGTNIFAPNNRDDFVEYLNNIEADMPKEHLEKVMEVYGSDWPKPYTTIFSD